MASNSSIPQATPAQLSVDLEALKANYRTLNAIAGPAACAAVVKADAYGLGVEQVSQALWAQGCRIFFVAILSEAENLRRCLPDAEIYVLGGLMKNTACEYRKSDIRPILASSEEIDEWSRFCRDNNCHLPAAVHVDTGINRLGLEYRDALDVFKSPSAFVDFELCMVMSHLACADEPYHPLNRQQVTKFEALRALAPRVPFSLANSAGTLSAAETHFDLVRCGIAIYGSNPIADDTVALEPVVGLYAPVLQIRNVAAGQSVGYGASFTCERASRIAIIGLGYADGYARNLSSMNAQNKANVYICGHHAPVIGRISMDMIGVDVTDLPENTVLRGMMAEVIGENISLDGVAQASETISYELLTRLGNRFKRVYT